MKGTRKDRRSKRIPAAHRLLLSIQGPAGMEISKEIVSTVELSQFGARIRGRRSLRPGAEGMLTQLRSGRQARIRIAWQERLGDSAEFFDTGLELLSGFDYWGISFADPAPGEVTQEAPSTSDPLTAHALLEEFRNAARIGAGELPLEVLWCGLIEQLEAKQLLERNDLVAAIRGLAQGAPARIQDCAG